jgi:2-methylcitrate dehydratase PrpD
MEGDQGFYCMMTGSSLIPELSELKPVNAVGRVYIKPYAACRHCHAPIDATLKIRSISAVKSEEIDSIQVRTHRYAVYLHDHVEIEGSASAKMSVPYSVAVSLITGRAGMHEFSDAYVSNTEVMRLARKVIMIADDELTALVPAKRAAIVEIKTLQGTVYSERVDLPKGEPENPVTEEELIKKFYDLAVFSGKTLDIVKEEARILVDTDIRILLTQAGVRIGY